MTGFFIGAGLMTLARMAAGQDLVLVTDSENSSIDLARFDLPQSLALLANSPLEASFVERNLQDDHTIEQSLGIGQFIQTLTAALVENKTVGSLKFTVRKKR